MKPILIAFIIANPACADPVFIDRTAALPSPHIYGGGWEHFVGGGVAVLDCNGDAKPDVFAAGGENPARLLINRTEGPGAPIQFEDSSIAAMTGVTGAYPLDIDGDGVLDLAVLRVGPDRLLRGGADCSFTDASDAWGFHPRDAWTTAFSATWEAGQVRPTLVFGHYVDRANPDGPFEACDTSDLYRPEGNGYGATEVIAPGFCTLSMLVSDWRRTGEPELRISNDRHYYVRGGYEQMFRLDPLAERTEDWPRISLWGMGIASQDVTGDGLPEVMMTSMGDQLLQINTGAGFVNAPYEIGTYAHVPFLGDDGRPSTGWHAEFGDIDNDGRIDLFIAKGNVDQMPSNAIHDPNNLLMQGLDGKFVEKADVAGVATTDRSRGAALTDLDGDGRLDIIVINRRAPMEVWQNATPDSGHWAGIELNYHENSKAVGAWIEIRTEAQIQTREVTVGGGHAGGQAGPKHFGLGPAGSAAVRITWPDGAISDWVRIPVDRVIRISPDRKGLKLVL